MEVENWIKVDKPLDQYPLGTKARATMGGYWIRVKRGWKWHCGDTFPLPGADWDRTVCLPKEDDTIELVGKGYACPNCGKFGDERSYVDRTESVFSHFPDPHYSWTETHSCWNCSKQYRIKNGT